MGEETSYLECGHNVNVEKFVAKSGCPVAYSCENGPQLSISDSWFKVIYLLLQKFCILFTNYRDKDNGALF